MCIMRNCQISCECVTTCVTSVIRAPEPCKVVSRVKFICVIFREFKGVVAHVWFAGAVIHTCEVAIKIQLVGVVTSVCRVGTLVLCSLCAECVMEDDLVCRLELFVGLQNNSPTTRGKSQFVANSLSPQLSSF